MGINITSAIEIINEYNFATKKSLGQNFLVDDEILYNISSSALSDEKNNFILEIGPGLGLLTQYLIQVAKKVVAIELDDKLVEILSKRFSLCNNFSILHSDFLDSKINNATLGNLFFENEKAQGANNQKIKVIANLPYYITSPIITKLLFEMKNVGDIYILVQKEVADRIVANKKTKDVGVLTIMCQFFGETKKLFDVSSYCFMPAPKVNSSFVEIKKTNKYIDLLVKKYNSKYASFKNNEIEISNADKNYNICANDDSSWNSCANVTNSNSININQEIYQNGLINKFFDFVKFCFSHKRKTLMNNLCSKYEKSKVQNLLSELNLSQTVRPEEISIENFIKIFCEIF